VWVGLLAIVTVGSVRRGPISTGSDTGPVVRGPDGPVNHRDGAPVSGAVAWS
jgi:hypothetical protein